MNTTQLYEIDEDIKQDCMTNAPISSEPWGGYNEISDTKHPQVTVYDPRGWPYEIDVEIAPLIEALWRENINTCNSCQENSPGIIWIEFESMEDLKRFLTKVISEIPPDDLDEWNYIYYRILGNQNELSWKYSTMIHDIRESYNEYLDEFIFDKDEQCIIEIRPSLRFPKSDYEHVLALFRAAVKRRESLSHWFPEDEGFVNLATSILASCLPDPDDVTLTTALRENLEAVVRKIIQGMEVGDSSGS